MKPWIKLLRPHQWTKNLLVFAAILFTARLSDQNSLVKVLLAFGAMCLVSSAVYIFNDLRDRQQDSAHPKKRERPLASGAIAPQAGAIAAVFLLGMGLVLAYSLGTRSLVVVLTYLALQVAYNLKLRSVPIADVFLIASGFVMRAALGATAIDVKISGWLLLCTGALALMLGFGKRRSEWVLNGDARSGARDSLEAYSKPALDALVVMAGTGAALCYGVYALDSPTAARFPGLILTTPFVFYGIARYVYVAFASDEGSEPDVLLFKDPHVLFSIFGFLVAAILATSGVAVPFLEGSPPR